MYEHGVKPSNCLNFTIANKRCGMVQYGTAGYGTWSFKLETKYCMNVFTKGFLESKRRQRS